MLGWHLAQRRLELHHYVVSHSRRRSLAALYRIQGAAFDVGRQLGGENL